MSRAWTDLIAVETVGAECREACLLEAVVEAELLGRPIRCIETEVPVAGGESSRPGEPAVVLVVLVRASDRPIAREFVGKVTRELVVENTVNDPESLSGSQPVT